MDRGGSPGQSIAGHKERPIEASSVVRHEPRGRWDRGGQGRQQRTFLSVVGEQELDLAELFPFPPAQSDEEGHGPCGRRQAGGLRVQADQWCADRRLAREDGQAGTVHGQGPGPRLIPDDDTFARADHLASDRVRQSDREVIRPFRHRRADREAACRGTIAFQTAGEGASTIDHVPCLMWQPREPSRPVHEAAAGPGRVHPHPAPDVGRCKPDSRHRSRMRR